MVYLDDRPVIEQLTEPTPANVIHDVHADAIDRAFNTEPYIRETMYDRLRDALAKADVELTDDVRREIGEFVGLEAAYTVDLIREALDKFADEALVRLEGMGA